MKFTLVIPVAPDRDAEILSSIANIDYPESEFEVIVTKGNNPSENRNKGAQKAKGDIIIFLDDDATIPADYLKEADHFFSQNPEVDIVGGPQLNDESDSGFSKLSGYALSSLFGAWKVSTRYTQKNVRFNVDETSLSSANLLCRKKVMDKMEFDTNLFPGEDTKFIAEAGKAGFNIAYTPTIRLFHRRRPGIRTLVQQIYSYGKVRPLKETIGDTMKMPFFFVPSLFLVYLAVLAFLGVTHYQPAASLLKISGIILFPLFAYIALAVFFSAYDAARNNDYKAAFALVFMYPLIHLSYGWGMIAGYLKKIFKK